MCLVAEVEITLKRSEKDFFKRALELFTLVVIDGEDKSKYFSVGRIYTKGVNVMPGCYGFVTWHP